MSNSRYEYVKKFEQPDPLLPHCWIVVRVDGRSFHKFSKEHEFTKPNDHQALMLMNKCAEEVINEYPEIEIAYGMSDEFSFILKKDTTLYGRRASKIQTSFVSHFAAAYVYWWGTFFPSKKLNYIPTFDARTICYPSHSSIRDYLCWRQVDCHINNLYNTCFWALVQKGHKTEEEAAQILKGKSYKANMNDILFSQFNINYNNEPQISRKGSILFKKKVEEVVLNPQTHQDVIRAKRTIVVVHEDLISSSFWQTPDTSELLKP